MGKPAKILSFKDHGNLLQKADLSDPNVLFEAMKEGFQKFQQGTRGSTPKYVKDVLEAVDKLRAFSDKYPWDWTIQDWDDWNFSNVDREKPLGKNSQRKYQNNIRQFMSYVEQRETYQRAAKQHFGVNITQFITKNAYRHLYEREQAVPRNHFTPITIEKFFDKLNEEIERYQVLGGREFTNLCRDLVLFYFLKATGLRISSVLALDTESFHPNTKIPEMGKYGGYITTAKGSRGAGPKTITGLFDDLDLSRLLDWYISTIRPLYMNIYNADESALFLSERGTRLTYSSAYNRFNQRLESAGLKGLNLVIHSFRHAVATDATASFGIEFARQKLNHKQASTTQGYAHVDDAYAADMVNKTLLAQLAKRHQNEGKL